MQYRLLGNSGLEVARLGLGTAMFGRVVERDSATRILDAYLDYGGNLIDTANIYGGSRDEQANVPGTTEALVGEIIKGRRHRLVLATKGHGSMTRDGWPNSSGLSRIYLRREVEESLRRLGTDHIDLYQCHSWDFRTPVAETVRALEELVSEGKIRYFGVSNWDGWHVVKGNSIAEAAGLNPFVSNQIWYNLADRSAEISLIPACRDQHVSIVSWGPIAQGVLSGRYARGSELEAPPSVAFDTTDDVTLISWRRLATTKTWDIVDQLRDVAGRLDATIPRVATRWLLQAGRCDVVLVGPSSVEQLLDSLAAMDIEIDQEDMLALDVRSRPIPTYPVSMYGRGYDD